MVFSHLMSKWIHIAYSIFKIDEILGLQRTISSKVSLEIKYVF